MSCSAEVLYSDCLQTAGQSQSAFISVRPTIYPISKVLVLHANRGKFMNVHYFLYLTSCSRVKRVILVWLYLFEIGCRAFERRHSQYPYMEGHSSVKAVGVVECRDTQLCLTFKLVGCMPYRISVSCHCLFLTWINKKLWNTFQHVANSSQHLTFGYLDLLFIKIVLYIYFTFPNTK